MHDNLTAIAMLSGKGTQIGARGIDVDHLLCTDGATTAPASPQIKEFYRYAISWKHGAIDLVWPDPREMADLLNRPEIARMVRQDLVTEADYVPGVSPANAALFAYDTLPAVFARTYFVFTDAAEPKVVDMATGYEEYDCLADYLSAWLKAFRAG